MQPILQQIETQKRDALHWQAAYWMDEAGTDPHKKGTATESIVGLLALIQSQFVADAYVDYFSKEYKISKKVLAGQVDHVKKSANFHDDHDDWEPENPLPEWADEKEVMLYGFAERISSKYTGYYFLDKNSTLTQRTNFVVTPLYHIYSQNSATNRRLMSVTNGYQESIVEMPSKGMQSVDQFCGVLYSEGTYLPQAGFTKDHLIKILGKISPQFVLAYELEQLGWQSEEGFFAFANVTYQPPTKDGDKGNLNEYNEYGAVKVGERHYISPSNSKANALVRSSDNVYENDMYLTYKVAPIDFKTWAELMVKVYGRNAYFALPFAIATLFRDIVIKITKIPHLYGYGGVGAGKSEWAESISYLFFSGLNSQGELYKPFNLNQGTEFAFWNGMERFFNCPYVLNEFDENSIDDIRFRAIKSAYDSEGRAKGMKERNRATMQKVVCTLVLIGQYLGTKDDNAVLMRSIPVSFKREDNRPDEQIKAFTELKGYERQGLSSILIEIMNIRHHFRKLFPEMFSFSYKTLSDDLRAEGVQAPQRIVKNIACMIATVELASKYLHFPYTADAFYSYAKDFTRSMSSLLASTSGVNEFWSMVEYLVDRHMIKEGIEFRINMADKVTVAGEGVEPEVRTFTPSKQVLYLRLSNVHKLYMEMHRKGSGRAPLNEQTLFLYIKDQPYFIGKVTSYRFKDKNTSCIALDYEKLGINLIKEEEKPAIEQVYLVGEIIQQASPTAVDGLLKFMIRTLNTSNTDGQTVTNNDVYGCFINDPGAIGYLQKGYKVQLRGALSVSEHSGKQYKQVDVIEYEAVPTFKEFEKQGMKAGAASAMPTDELPF